MSEFKLYMVEKQKIDEFIAEGYRISTVKETWNGDEVEFIHPHQDQPILLRIQTAEGRKYFSSIIKTLQKSAPHS